MKDLALSPDESLPVYNRCAIHALAAAYLNLICQLTTVPAFCQHVHEVEDLEFLSDTFVWFTIICVNKRPLSSALQVIEVRQKESHYLLPEDIFIDNPKYVPHFTFISSSYRTTATLDGIFKRSIHARKCLVSAKKNNWISLFLQVTVLGGQDRRGSFIPSVKDHRSTGRQWIQHWETGNTLCPTVHW